MKSVQLFMIQLNKMKKSPTGIVSTGCGLFFLHLGAVILAFQSIKTDALELSECLSRIRSLDENTLRGLPPLTVHLNLPLAESILQITATEMILFVT